MKIGFQGDIFSNAEEATDRFIRKLNIENVTPVALITSKNYAVICRKNAGKFYGLHLLAENIEDDKSNKTLFGLYKLK